MFGKVKAGPNDHQRIPEIIQSLDKASKVGSKISISELPSLSLKEIKTLNQVSKPSFMPPSADAVSDQKSLKMPRLTAIGAAGLLKAQKENPKSKEDKQAKSSVLSEHVKRRFRNPYQNI